MSNEILDQHKQIVRRLYEACINPGRLDLIDTIVGDAYIGPQGERGPAGFRGTLDALRNGMPDIHFTIDDLIAEGDRVAVRWHWVATHTGEFRGLAPSGVRATNSGVAFYQLQDGRIVRAWLETDRLGFLEQIGAIPPRVSPAAAARA
jgi:predicted ester cyclase